MTVTGSSEGTVKLAEVTAPPPAATRTVQVPGGSVVSSTIPSRGE